MNKKEDREQEKNIESLKINIINFYELDTNRDSWGDVKDILLTPRNINKIYNKQCEIIETINKILDIKILIK